MTAAWFERSLATPFEEHVVDVEGCPIHYLRWGDPSKPGVMMVHGGLAHAHWWRHLAPLLLDDYHVVAPELSGHGDSGRRGTYSGMQWVREIMGVYEDAGLDRPHYIGHSMGGIVGLGVAAEVGERFRGVIISDSPVHQKSRREPDSGGGRTFRHMKTYPDLETGMARFRFIPNQPCENDFIVDHLARTSLKEVEDGWRWKFDPLLFEKIQPVAYEPLFEKVSCPWAFLRGERSKVVPPEARAYFAEKLGGDPLFITIPEADHHVIADQPLAFISAVSAIMQTWNDPSI